MQKTVKKLEKNVITALTQACEAIKQKVPGFVWLTHYARYDRFPSSLAVICIFDTEDSQAIAKEHELDISMRKLIHSHLLKMGIVLKDSRKNVFFDNEEACQLEHHGDWERRLKIYS